MKWRIDRMEIMNKMQEIFRDVFDDESLVITEATNAEDIDEWDSLTHITILQSVQDEFGVEFSITEIDNMKNVGDMINAIKQKI